MRAVARRLAGPMLLLACVAAVFAPMAAGRLLLSEDLCTFSLPLLHVTRASWASGGPPLWAPAVSAGFPVLAEGELGPLYPLHILLLLALPAAVAMNVSLALHLFISGAGTYAYLKAIGRGAAASSLGGVSFMLALPLMAGLQELPLVVSIAWLPALFLCAERAASGGGRWIAAAGVVLGLQLLAGHPQGAFLSLLAWPPYLLWRCRDLGISPRRSFGKLVMILALGGGLSLPQFVARFELLMLSSRTLGQADPLSYSFPPRQLLTLLIPSLFGVRTSAHPDAYWGAWNLWSTSVYVGVVALALAAVALIGWRKPFTRFYAVLALVPLLLAFGSYFAPAAFVLSMPPFVYFRAPGRFLILTGFALSVLAALALSRLAAPGIARARTGVGLAVAGAVLFIALAAAHVALRAASEPLQDYGRRYYGARSDAMAPALREPAAVHGRVVAIHSGLLRTSHPLGATVLVPFIALVTAGIALALRRVPGGPRVGTACVVVVAAAEMVFVARPLHIWSDPLPDGAPPVAASLGGVSGARVISVIAGPSEDCHVARAGLVGNVPALYDLPFLGLVSPLRVRYQAEMLPLFDERDAARRDAWLVKHRRALAVWGVGRIVTGGEIGASGVRLVASADGGPGPIRVYELDGALPRVYIADTARTVASSAQTLTLLAEGIDSRRAVLLADSIPTASVIVPDRRGTGHAHIDRDDATVLRVSVRTPDSAWLVVNDAYYPGWTASVDGRPTPIVRANGFVRAVALPAGSHVVDMEYRPRWLWPSVAVALAALACAAVLAWRG